MKKSIILIIVAILLQTSCIVKEKYKESDIFEKYETEKGFGVFHIPPILFKIVFSLSDDTEFEAGELLDKIDVIKVLFFEESEETIKLNELNNSIKSSIKEFNYNLLTKIAQEKNDVSIYVIDQDEVIREVLIIIISDKEYIGLNLVGKLTRDDVMNAYKAIDLNNLKDMSN